MDLMDLIIIFFIFVRSHCPLGEYSQVIPELFPSYSQVIGREIDPNPSRINDLALPLPLPLGPHHISSCSTIDKFAGTNLLKMEYGKWNNMENGIIWKLVCLAFGLLIRIIVLKKKNKKEKKL